ncbi:MAG TPA: RnfABCDGE type electron transport complex subunit C, partial [Bacillota bacterium]|nr:RnfABCDGE type electron transport complex subunit C [Bacillota bacterium]
NVAECEPFLTADHREVVENSWNVMSGVYAVKEILGIKRVIIGVEGNKPDAIEQLHNIAESETNDPNDEVRILKLKPSYPQGAEKILIQACTGRRVPPGKLPSDVGCIVMNVTSIAFLSQYMKTGMPLVSKRITVDGSAVKEPKNVIVPIGTSVSDVIEFCGGLAKDAHKYLYGGPMMGTTIIDPEMVVMKNTNGLLALDEKDAVPEHETECIRCGRCIDACPMSLSPLLIAKAVKRHDTQAMAKYDLMSCMECGCCAYTCPAKRNLVQTMRYGKMLLKEASKRS